MPRENGVRSWRSSSVRSFCEKVRQKNKLEKLNPRWEYGVFVGVKVTIGETWVVTKEGLQAVRSVRRLSVE